MLVVSCIKLTTKIVYIYSGTYLLAHKSKHIPVKDNMIYYLLNRETAQ